MKPLTIPLEEFLRPFFDPGELICLRVFDDRRTGTFKGAKIETSLEKIDSIRESLKKHNDMHRGIYFVVNFGGHEDNDIKRINAHFMECDDLSFEDQMKEIDAFSLEPSLIVKTKKSLHTYWLMKEASVTEFRMVQKKLAAHFQGDKTCINESRVLRLPGFNHCKGEPVMVECMKFSPELKYTQAELEAALPEVEAAPAQVAPQVLKGDQRGLSLVRSGCDFIKHCQENAESLPEHDWYAMITNLAVFDGGAALIHELSHRYPKYSEEETDSKIQHFLESGTKPMTCRTISEKGFQCPGLVNGSCSCKAPAAMCYQPLSIESLRANLQDKELKSTAVDNINAAQEFVTANLYNIEPAIAEAFIRYDMKAYFNLKASDTKPILALYKDTYKKYSSSRDKKREMTAIESELPAWYEINENGGLRFVSGLLADHMAKNVDAFYGAGSYYYYENGVYSAYEDLWASAKVREFMIARYARMYDINDSVGQWKILIRKPVREINCNPFIINVQNGLYNVLGKEFKPHTPKYYSTVQIMAAYREDAKYHNFQAFLSSVLQDEEIHLIQEIFGYLLIPINKAQKSFVFVGAPNAGKSTLLSVAQEILLGAENVSNIPWQGLGDRFNKAELFGKLANIFADLPSKNIDDNGMFKALTGEDYITGERKNKDPFSFRPYARLLFSCNEIPRNYGDRSDGFYRRLIIIRFDNSVSPDKRDPNLREKLAAERDGILMWALVGLRRLIANSYEFTETYRTRAELQRYKVESNSALSFVEEYCELFEAGEAVRDELFSRYKEYCGNAGLRPLSQSNFNKEIETGFQSVKRSRDKLSKRRTWKGISYCEGGKG